MTTDKRAAAIAALKKAVQRYRDTEHGVRPGWVDSEVIRTAQEAIAALEADDGRALLRNRLADWCVQHGAALCPGARADTFGEGMREAKRQVRGILDSVAPEQPAQSHAFDRRRPFLELPDKVEQWCVEVESGEESTSIALDRAVAAFLRSLVREKPEQSAPLCSECGAPMPVPLAHCCEKPEQPAPEPAAPHADDEARIAECIGKINRLLDSSGCPECDSRAGSPREVEESVLDDIEGVLRSLAAGKAKAEAEVQRLTGILDDLSSTRATKDDEVADLRAKLAEAEAAASNALSLMRAKEAECAMATLRAERAEGEAKALRAERDAAVAKLAEAEKAHEQDQEIACADEVAYLKEIAVLKQQTRCPECGCASPEDAEAAECGCEAPVCMVPASSTLAREFVKALAERDAAVAAQNTRAEELLRRLREGALETATLIEGVGGDFARGSADAWRAAVGRIDALRAEKPAAEPVPDAADAMIPPFEGDPKDCAFKPAGREGDEVLRDHLDVMRRHDGQYEPMAALPALRLAVIALLERALGEVRP